MKIEWPRRNKRNALCSSNPPARRIFAAECNGGVQKKSARRYRSVCVSFVKYIKSYNVVVSRTTCVRHRRSMVMNRGLYSFLSCWKSKLPRGKKIESFYFLFKNFIRNFSYCAVQQSCAKEKSQTCAKTIDPRTVAFKSLRMKRKKKVLHTTTLWAERKLNHPSK